MGSRSFGSGQDHQAGKPCAARAVAEGRTGHVVGCLDYETLGRRQFFQYGRDLVTGVAAGAFQNPCLGLRPLSRDISSGFSDSLFFPSALFNSLVRRLGRSSGTYSLEAGPGGSGHQLTAAHRTTEAGCASGARNRSRRRASTLRKVRIQGVVARSGAPGFATCPENISSSDRRSVLRHERRVARSSHQDRHSDRPSSRQEDGIQRNVPYTNCRPSLLKQPAPSPPLSPK